MALVECPATTISDMSVRSSRSLATVATSALLLLTAACGNASAASLPTWTGPSPLASSAPSGVAAPPPKAPAPAVSTAGPPAPEARFGFARLVLPDLDADAEVVEVGVSDDRVLEVPPDAGVVGRWSDGAAPGDGVGSIVLVNHVDYRGVPGVFKRLAEIESGAEAVLVGADGQEARYVLESLETYRKATLPFEEIFLFDVPERLVLITCGGEIDPATGRYDSNVVAYFRRV